MSSRIQFLYHNGECIRKMCWNSGVKCINPEYTKALEEKINTLLEQAHELSKELGDSQVEQD